MLRPNSPTQFRSDAVILAKALSKAAGSVSWPHMPQRKEFEAMADHIVAAGCCGMEEFIDTSNAGRARLLKIAFVRKACWAGFLWKVLDA